MSDDTARVYLDHNATSPLREAARVAIEMSLDAARGNPSSLHSDGRASRALVERAREQVAELIACSPNELVFTSGGTEALAAAIHGVAERAPATLRRFVVSAVEHSAVLESVRLLSRRGFEVVQVGCDREGRVDADEFLAALEPGAALAVLQWANNETGVVQPVEEVGRGCRSRGVPFLVDAVQAAGKIAVDPRRALADLLVLSAHKVGGPQGAGALFVRDGIVLTPLIAGGAQEKRRRGGTPAVLPLVGFGAAAAAALAALPREPEHLLRLRAKLETRLRQLFPEILFHGQAASRLPNTVNFSIPGLPGETLAIALDLAGVSVSTGSACASGAVEPSHVLLAMGRDEAEARGAVRLSLGWSTTGEEIERLLDLLPGVVERTRIGLSESR